MEKSSKLHSKKIALAGILTALGAAALFLENLIPTGKLGFYVLAGFILSVVIMECGFSFGWLSYVAVSTIAFLLVPEKTAVLPYVLFFGIYSLVKSHIEQINKLIIEWVLKFAFFSLSLFFMWNIAVQVLDLIPPKLVQSLPVYGVVLVLQAAFFTFDWIFTFFTQYYINKISSKIHSTDSAL
ncbi:MAG: hypothetical protein KBA53_04040 [Thermoclostridium sp.]|nr:hypothetical protein [Thermoclostridium sp.]